MCLLELFKLHVTHKTFQSKSFENNVRNCKINSIYPEFLLLKVSEDNETVSTALHSMCPSDKADCSRFHEQENEKR